MLQYLASKSKSLAHFFKYLGMLLLSISASSLIKALKRRFTFIISLRDLKRKVVVAGFC